MDDQLCFVIETKKIYLEQVLVDYDDIPIFFLCRDDRQYYIALCTDIDDLNYIVTKISVRDVYDLLHGNIQMRDVILNQKEYWTVISGEEICQDEVNKCMIQEIDITLLPDENAYFEILTSEAKAYVARFDSEYFAPDCFITIENTMDLTESYDVQIEGIEMFDELGQSHIECINSGITYGEVMANITSAQTAIKIDTNFEQLDMGCMYLMFSDMTEAA